MKGFPTRSPPDLEHRPQEQQWLVDGLWGRQAVGIIGGEPKCGKSFLALDLAVAVAAGVPCLRRFEADQPGPVLMFAAEDAGHIVRTRLQGIARAAGADFETLDIAVIDVPTLRLDHRNDRQRLQETMERIEPRLLVLDPLVRLHGVDENAVADIAPILGFLRDLQRRFETAVLLVHHSRKSGATRPGQALRGSSELHAWGDSNLYLRRRDKQIVMTVEHRAAPGLNDIEVDSPTTVRGWLCASAGRCRPRPRRNPKPPNSASSRRSRMPKRRSRSARSANVPQPGLRPLAPRSRSSSGNTASSVHPEAATVSPAPASTARTRYRKPLPPRTPRERR